MTEQEFTVLDELYFIVSFNEIQESIELSSQQLKLVLISLWEKGWLRCYSGIENELDIHTIDIENQFDKYHYLASKEGLMAHNTL
jgi:hypothetical protein